MGDVCLSRHSSYFDLCIIYYTLQNTRDVGDMQDYIFGTVAVESMCMVMTFVPVRNVHTAFIV